MRFITALTVTLTLACSPAFACGHAKHHPLQKLFHRAHHAAHAVKSAACKCCKSCTHAKGCDCACPTCKCNK